MISRKQTIINILIPFMTIVSPLIGAGYKVSGYVYHAETAEPIPGVNVILKNTDLGAATLKDGSFSI